MIVSSYMKHVICVFSVVHSPRKADYSGHEFWVISEVHSVRKRQQTQFTVRGIPGNLKEKITRWGWSNTGADCGNSMSGNFQNWTGDPNYLFNSWDLPHFKQAVAIRFQRSLSARTILWQVPQYTDLAGHCTSSKLLLIWNGKDFALCVIVLMVVLLTACCHDWRHRRFALLTGNDYVLEQIFTSTESSHNNYS